MTDLAPEPGMIYMADKMCLPVFAQLSQKLCLSYTKAKVLLSIPIILQSKTNDYIKAILLTSVTKTNLG